MQLNVATGQLNGGIGIIIHAHDLKDKLIKHLSAMLTVHFQELQFIILFINHLLLEVSTVSD